MNVMDHHDKIVSDISARVRQFHERKEAFRIYHGSTNSTRQSQYTRDRMVDTSPLTKVLKVDTSLRVAVVEPNVPMDLLVEATLRYGLIPPVVMEFPGITTGGGFAGTSGESSSYKYGFFDRTINWVEIVLANGETVIASPKQHSDLFYGAAASFGTLGVTTLLEVQLIDAKAFVELTYQPILSMSEGVRRIEQATKDPDIDYLDGILYSAHDGVLCIGKLVDNPRPGVRVQRFTRPRDPWFYLHVRELLRGRTETVTEAIPLVDYLFRYDRGGFWVGKYAFHYFITPFNRITRWVLDYFMHTRVMYHALHKSGLGKEYVIQDVAIPYPKALDFVEYLDKDFKNYPIWLCPLKQTGQSVESPRGLLAEKSGAQLPDMMLNFGVWGPGSKKREQFVAWNRSFEHKVRSLGGQKWLYAQAYYTEEEFYEIYSRKEYDALRKKYHASHLPSVYDKVKVDVEAEKKAIEESWSLWFLAFFWSIWPLAGLYGVYKALMGGDYLLPRKSRIAGEKKLL